MPSGEVGLFKESRAKDVQTGFCIYCKVLYFGQCRVLEVLFLSKSSKPQGQIVVVMCGAILSILLFFQNWTG